MTNEEKVNSWRVRLVQAGWHGKLGLFAQSAGVHPKSFSQYINGRVFPSAKNIDKIEIKLREIEGE